LADTNLGFFSHVVGEFWSLESINAGWKWNPGPVDLIVSRIERRCATITIRRSFVCYFGRGAAPLKIWR